MAYVGPTVADVQHKVPELRELFKEKYASSISKGEYDQRDVDRLNDSEDYAICFLRTLKSKGEPKKAIELIDTAFKFRKEMKMCDIALEDFPAEIIDRKGIYMKGEDKDGHPILYIDVSQNVATGDQVPILKRFIAYNFEVHHKANCEQRCVVLMDMSKAGTGNVNLDVTKYIIQCMTTYFPSYLAYMLNYEMPFILNATWKVISAFLNSDQKQKLLMVKKKDITKYINEDNLWDHMKS